MVLGWAIFASGHFPVLPWLNSPPKFQSFFSLYIKRNPWISSTVDLDVRVRVCVHMCMLSVGVVCAHVYACLHVCCVCA